MKYLINYANDDFKRKQIFSSYISKYFGSFDKVISYRPSDIDSTYYKKFENIFSLSRGGGYWLWKSYIINKTLEIMGDGDYLFYCDSGAYFIRSVDKIIENMNGDVMCFGLPLLESDFTNQYTKDFFNNKKIESMRQVIGGYILIRKSKYSCSFFSEYQKLCENENILTDKKNRDNECHRHDQSILSYLYKSKELDIFKDPSDYGKFPYQYKIDGKMFIKEKIKGDYPVTILSNRKANPCLYFIKYFIKSFIL